MLGAAAISPHDVNTAVTETRRAVTQLGMKTIFLRPNIYVTAFSSMDARFAAAACCAYNDKEGLDLAVLFPTSAMALRTALTITLPLAATGLMAAAIACSARSRPGSSPR
jgi:hypothetical protein